MRLHILPIILLVLLAPPTTRAGTLLVKNMQGEPMSQVMVTRTPLSQPAADLSDDGYTPHGITNASAMIQTRFGTSQWPRSIRR